MDPFILVMVSFLISKGSAGYGYLADRKINPQGATPFLNIKVENPDLEAEICDNAAIYCSKQSTYSIDGSCNSLNHPYAGAAGMPYERLFGPAYDLSLRETKATLNSLPRHARATMPSPGFLSQNLHDPIASAPAGLTYLLNSFAAFMLNDVSLPPKKEKVDCCDGDYDDLKDCAPFHEDQSLYDGICLDGEATSPMLSLESVDGMKCALAVDGQFESSFWPSDVYTLDPFDRYQSLAVVCYPESVGQDSIAHLVNSDVEPVIVDASTIVADADLGFKITVTSSDGDSDILTDMDRAGLWRCTDQPSSVAWSEPNFDDASWRAAVSRGEFIWTSGAADAGTPSTVFCRLTRRPDYNYITVGGTGPLEMWLNGISRPLKNGQDVELSDRVHLSGKIEMAALKLTLTDKSDYLANGLLYETNVVSDYVRCLPSHDPNGPEDWFTCDFDDSAWKAPIESSSTSSVAGINNNNWITGKASQASYLYCRIKITNSDRCISYKRTQPYCYEHGTPRRAWRQQVNYQTAFLDLSQIYGTTKARSELLRTKEHGLMKTSQTAGTCKGELPLRMADEDGHLDDTQPTLISGDDQHLLIPVVQALYTTFIRAHNHIANALRMVNSYLSDEELYQEARRINIAQYQAIIYSELMPFFTEIATSSEFELPEYPSMYDTTMKPGTLLSADLINRYISAITRAENIDLMSADDAAAQMTLTDYLSGILTAGSDDPIFNSDCASDNLLRYETMNVEDLFDNDVAAPLLCSNDKFDDMIAQLFMTGRDHGLQSYQKYSDFCGNPNTLSDPESDIIKGFYRREKDMDLLAGIRAEFDETGNTLSYTGICLSVLQFNRLVTGDKFFFSHSTSNGQTGDFKPPYTTEQRDYIRTRKLSNVLCETTNLAEVFERVFRGPLDLAGNPTRTTMFCDELIMSEPFDASLFVGSGYHHHH